MDEIKSKWAEKEPEKQLQSAVPAVPTPLTDSEKRTREIAAEVSKLPKEEQLYEVVWRAFHWHFLKRRVIGAEDKMKYKKAIEFTCNVLKNSGLLK